MYKCLECERIFDRPRTISEDLTPGGAFEGGSFIYHYEVCPYCESSSFKELKECDNCGYYEIKENGEYIKKQWLCESCIEEMEKKKNGNK